MPEPAHPPGDPATPSLRYDLGVLFVHGIGSQRRGETLVRWGDSLASWLSRWLGQRGQDLGASVAAARFGQEGGPAYATLEVAAVPGAPASRWLLAESYWADTLTPPRYADLFQWSTAVVPRAILSHLVARRRWAMSRLPTRRLLWLVAAPLVMAREGVVFLMGVAAVPFVLASLVLILLLGWIPVPAIRSLAASVQRLLAATLGDSLVLLGSPMQEAAILTRVRGDLAWLRSARCRRLCVVAHSQGAAIAHEVLKGAAAPAAQLLLTFGAGIRKLEETRDLMESAGAPRWGAWIMSAGAILTVASMRWSLPALWEVLGRVLLGLVLYLALITAATAPPKGKLPFWVRIVLMLAAVATLWMAFQTWVAVHPGGWLTLIGLLVIEKGSRLVSTGDGPRVEERAGGFSWLDLYASADPVSNGPLFRASSAARQSDEVCNRRSVLGDHGSYWAAGDDFVGRVACALGREAGLEFDRLQEDDYRRLVRARHRRRWRVGWLQAARLATMGGLLAIAAARGVPASLEEVPPLLRPAFSGTFTTLDVFTPDALAVWTRDADRRNRVPGPGATRGVSLAGLALLAYLAYALAGGWWRAWDRQETAILFARGDYELWDARAVAFLLTLVAGVELSVLTAGGWLRELLWDPVLLDGPLRSTATVSMIVALPFYPRVLWAIVKGKGALLLSVVWRATITMAASFLLFLPPLLAAVAGPLRAAAGQARDQGLPASVVWAHADRVWLGAGAVALLALLLLPHMKASRVITAWIGPLTHAGPLPPPANEPSAGIASAYGPEQLAV